MARHTPLMPLHAEAGAAFVRYELPDAPDKGVAVVAAFERPDAEYASLRRGTALLDMPHRAIVEVTGADRVDFLNRMITQELRAVPDFSLRRAFWLNRKGRIDADLRVAILPDRVLLELDIHALERTLGTLGAFIITEDVALADATERTHRLSLHGPTALRALADAAGQPGVPDSLAPGRAWQGAIRGADVVALRDDSAGEVGIELAAPSDAACEVYEHLLAVGAGDKPGDIRLRPAGWHAYNVARIEAGTPLYHIDFATDALPHETGVLRDRVSFTKGCYLGQEIVARMESLGRPRRSLVALRIAGDAAPDTPQPDAGDPVLDPAGPDAPVGHITSSTISPMLGGVPVCFAMIKTAHTAPGSRLHVLAAGRTVGATVQPSLVFHRRA